MNLEQQIRCFLEIEKKYELFDIKINNIKIWNYVRFDVYHQISKTYNGTEDNFKGHLKPNNKKLYPQIKSLVLNFKKVMFNYKNLSEKDILIINHERRIKENNFYNCIYTDKLIKELEVDKSMYVLEKTYASKHYSPVKTPNLFYLDWLEFKIGIQRVIIHKLKINNLNDKDIESIRQINKIIQDTYKIDIDITKTIINQIVKYKCSKKYYEQLFSVIKPKLLIEVVSYGFERQLMNEIAKEKGTKIVELQHGTMGKYHIGYNYSVDKNKTNLPDFIFLFGEYWKKSSALPLKNDSLIVTGFPHFEHKIEEYIKKRNSNAGRKIILFISQGYIGKNLSKFATELNEIIDKEKYEIIYKLHPGEYDYWETNYQWLKNSDIEVIDNNLKDVYYYFSISDVQVGVSSTALFEGLAFDLVTLIYKDIGHEYMEDLFEMNLGYLVTEPTEVLGKLTIKEERREINKTDLLWETDSLTKMKKNIDEIMNCS